MRAQCTHTVPSVFILRITVHILIKHSNIHKFKAFQVVYSSINDK